MDHPSAEAPVPTTLDEALHLPPDVEDLLGQLLIRIGKAVPGAGLAPADVGLEVWIGGQRYSLAGRAPAPAPAPVTLSPREQEIVRLVAAGLPNKAIAAVLEISAWTVATHLRRVFAKLEVSSRAEMVARALHLGLVGRSGMRPPQDKDD